jgi:hypothetical protein
MLDLKVVALPKAFWMREAVLPDNAAVIRLRVFLPHSIIRSRTFICLKRAVKDVTDEQHVSA